MRYADLIIKICSFAYIVDQNQPKSKQLVIKKTELEKTETAVFAIKTDRNRTGKSKPHRLNSNPYFILFLHQTKTYYYYYYY